MFCFVLQDYTAHWLKRFTTKAVNIFSSFDIFFFLFYKKYRTLFYEKWRQTTSSTKVRLLLRVLAMYVTQYVFGTLRLLQSLSSFNWWWEYTSSSKPSKALLCQGNLLKGIYKKIIRWYTAIPYRASWNKEKMLLKLLSKGLRLRSVLERIWIKWLPQVERWPPKESKSLCIEVLHGGSH